MWQTITLNQGLASCKSFTPIAVRPYPSGSASRGGWCAAAADYSRAEQRGVAWGGGGGDDDVHRRERTCGGVGPTWSYHVLQRIAELQDKTGYFYISIDTIEKKSDPNIFFSCYEFYSKIISIMNSFKLNFHLCKSIMLSLVITYHSEWLSRGEI